MAKPLNKHYNRWLLLIFAIIASFIFTGCESENLGVKSTAITGHVLDDDTNQPISDVVLTLTGGAYTYTTVTDADGSYTFTDLTIQPSLKISKVEKYGYKLATETQEFLAVDIQLKNGSTYNIPTIKMWKDYNSYKGTLKAYPVDDVTGKPLANFTVTQTAPYNQRKSKTFETAADFRDSGWTNLDGGEHHYTITATGYETFNTESEEAGLGGNPIIIGNAVTNLGTIRIKPITTVSVSGTLILPGYVINGEHGLSVWAESAGKRVASYTTEENYNSYINYTLEGIPTSAGTVTIKCKLRGYNVVTLKSNLVVNATNPGGVIAIGEKDFINEVEPITRDLKVIIMGKSPEEGLNAPFGPGKIATVYLVQGNTTIQEVQAASVNGRATAIFPNVPTGYKMSVFAICDYMKSDTYDIENLEEGSGYFICPEVLELEEI